MTTRQPEALRLAEILECGYSLAWLYERGGYEVSAELRRQQARITDLEAQLEAIGAGGVSGPLMGRQPGETGMSRDEIIAMARQAGLGMMLEDETTSGPMWEDELHLFADLVAQREREMCANLCEQQRFGIDAFGSIDHHVRQAAEQCAQAIRLRGRT